MLEQKVSYMNKELWYTDGPATLNKEEEMFLAGATGVRLTFSYSTQEYQHNRAIVAKEAAARVGKSCFIVADLTGEKFRLGRFNDAPTVTVTQDHFVRLIPTDITEPTLQDLTLPIPESSFYEFQEQVKKGNIITVGDGSVMLEVLFVGEDEISATTLSDGTIDQMRGLTIQDTNFRPRSLTSKDIDDLAHILSLSIYDAVAISFVSSEEEIIRIKEAASTQNRQIAVIAKIETAAGVANIEKICMNADCVMAARGDLALAIPWVELPSTVKAIADTAKAASIPWILATQIAEGLQRFVIPTRAEICDLAHWRQEGCAGVLLSYETAFGAKPNLAVECTAKILARW
ncbi:MAG: hypothetical protein GY797_30375 [Deltaproteobacteria bacterium]|nr:hypothetical protein [Deltaproteobacteria bacterium]